MPEELNRKVDLLVSEVHGLRDDVQAVGDELAEANDRAERAEKTANRSRSWIKILVPVVLAVVLALVGAFYLIQQNNHKFCGVIQISAKAIPPPTTQRGVDAQRESRQLARQFGCP